MNKNLSEEQINWQSDKVRAKYSKELNVTGIFLIGSAARRSTDEYSDIDYYIITEGPDETSRKAYRNDDGISIELLFDTEEDTLKYLESERGQLYRNVASMLADAVLLYCAKDHPSVSNLPDLAGEVLLTKTKVDQSVVTMHKYSLEDFLSDMSSNVKTGDSIAFGINSAHFIDNVVALFHIDSEGYFEKADGISSSIKAQDKALYDLLNKFYSAVDLNDRLSILKELSALANNYGGPPLPRDWQV